jgi:hypothetical protein
MRIYCLVLLMAVFSSQACSPYKVCSRLKICKPKKTASFECNGTCRPGGQVTGMEPTSLLPGDDEQIASLIGAIDDDRVLDRIRVLSGARPVEGETLISSRSTKHPDHGLALAWIRIQLEDASLTVNEVTGSETTLWAEIPGTNPDLAPVVVVSHYDSISNENGMDPASYPAPGANDNGTGVAINLELISALQDSGVSPPRTLRVIFADGEELGFLGATAYVKSLSDDSEIACSLSADMLGGAIGSPIGHYWFKYNVDSSDYAALGFEAIARFAPDARPIPSQDETDAGTDSIPFRSAGHCSVSMYGWPYPWPVHTSSDTVANLEPDFLAANTRAVISVAAAWLMYGP